MEYEPSLATSWQALDDTTWEFKLRQGVKFHNGDPFSAEDVKFSFERVLDPDTKSPQYGNIRAIKEVKIIDPHTIHLVTDKPFRAPRARGLLPDHPQEALREGRRAGLCRQRPVGTGPYKFAEWKRDQYLRLERFDEHWRASRLQEPHHPRHPGGRHADRRAEDGWCRYHPQPVPRSHPELKAHANTYVSTAPILRTHYVSLDMREAPFNKKEARQAANYAIDRQAIVEKLMGGLGRRWRPSSIRWRWLRPESGGLSLRPQEGQRATEAGWLSRTAWTSRCIAGVGGVQPPAREAIAEMLTEVGMRTNLKIWDPGPAWNKFFQGEGKATHGFIGSWGYYSTFDADAILHPLYHTEPGGWVGQVVHARGRPG